MRETDLVRGTVAGFVATLPMSLVMSSFHQQLPPEERYPQEPSLVTQEIEQTLALNQYINEPRHMLLTLLSHFGFGAAAGAFYAPVTRSLHLAPALRGIIYGMGVWALSYQGVLPGLGILPPERERPASRTALLITAHVVWGLALGVLFERWEQRSRQR